MLEPGQEITAADGQTYSVVRKLGLGKTAVVFEAVAKKTGQQVAIKLRLPDLDKTLQQLFDQERVNLVNLAKTEARHYVPQFYGAGTASNKNYFLVEDFVGTPPLDDLLASDGLLSEEDGLELGRQFMLVLTALHSLGHTYTDMKLENIHWDRERRHVVVTDWNVIGSYTDDVESRKRFELDKRRDLLRFSGYLYQTLTSEPLASRTGLSKSQLQKSERFKGLTLSTQWLLMRALHPNETRRFQSALEFLKALSEASELWQVPDAQLLSQTEHLADKSDQAGVLSLLDLLKKRRELKNAPPNPLVESMYQDALASYNASQAEEQAHAEVVRAFYVAGDLVRSRERVDKAFLDDPYDLAVWRWKQAVEVAQSLGKNLTSEIRDLLQAAVENLQEERWPLAYDQLTKQLTARHHLSYPQIEQLTHDCDVMSHFNNARKSIEAEDYATAETSLRQAQTAQEAIRAQEYRNALQQITGDLGQQIDEVRQIIRASQLQKDLKNAELYANQNDARSLEIVRRVIDLDSRGEVVTPWCLRVARKLLGESPAQRPSLQISWGLLTMAASTRAATPEVSRWARLAGKLYYISSLRQNGQVSEAYKQFKDLLEVKTLLATEQLDQTEQIFWKNLDEYKKQLLRAVYQELRKKLEEIESEIKDELYDARLHGHGEGRHLKDAQVHLDKAAQLVKDAARYRHDLEGDDSSIDTSFAYIKKSAEHMRSLLDEASKWEYELREREKDRKAMRDAEAEKQLAEVREKERTAEIAHAQELHELEERKKENEARRIAELEKQRAQIREKERAAEEELANTIRQQFYETVTVYERKYKHLLKEISDEKASKTKSWSKWRTIYQNLKSLEPFNHYLVLEEISEQMTQIMRSKLLAMQEGELDTRTPSRNSGAHDLSRPSQPYGESTEPISAQMEQIGQLLSKLREEYKSMQPWMERALKLWEKWSAHAFRYPDNTKGLNKDQVQEDLEIVEKLIIMDFDYADEPIDPRVRKADVEKSRKSREISGAAKRDTGSLISRQLRSSEVEA